MVTRRILGKPGTSCNTPPSLPPTFTTSRCSSSCRDARMTSRASFPSACVTSRALRYRAMNSRARRGVHAAARSDATVKPIDIRTMTRRAEARPVRSFSGALAWLLFVGATMSSGTACAADGAFVEPTLDEVVIDPITPAVTPFPRNIGHDVLTQRNNNQRTGTAAWTGFNQTSLTNGRFGLLKVVPVDGPILAQPLFMESVEFRLPFLSATRAVVYVAMAKNKVCAFDADPPFSDLWGGCTNLGEPFSRPITICAPDDEECRARQACPGQMTTAENDPNLYIGIESTPVIDPVLKRIFVSYRTAQNRQRIAALDTASGARLLDAEVDGDPLWNRLHRNRASLLIVGDLLFVAFAGMCEDPGGGFGGEYAGSYQGWIYAFDTRTLTRVAGYRTMQSAVRSFGAPSSDPVAGGGIWQASTGLAAVASGNIFFSTGNATRAEGWIPPDPSWKNLSNSVVRLRVARATPMALPPATTLSVVDWFTPYRKVWQERIDMDLGAAGVVLIPGTTYMVTGGKEGILYLLDANHLGKFDAIPPFDATMILGKHQTAASAPDDPARDHGVQKFRAAKNQYCAASKPAAEMLRLASLFCFDEKYMPNAAEVSALSPTMDAWLPWPHIHGTPVFGAFPDGSSYLYLWAEKDNLKSFRWLGNRFDPSARIAVGLPQPGGLGVQQPVLAPPYLAR